MDAGPAAADTPIRLDNHLSLRRQFAYVPAYECNLPSFDAANRAYIRSRTVTPGRHRVRLRAGRRRVPARLAPRRRASDVSWLPRHRQRRRLGRERRSRPTPWGRLYTLLEVKVGDGSLRNLLLYSTDSGRSWRVLRLPFTPPRSSPDGRNDGTCASEHLAGFNLRGEPPLIAVWRPVGDWPGYRACRMALYVVQPRFEGDRLVLPDPVPVTDRGLGLVQAAGGASFAATVGTTTYIVWAEVAPVGASGSPVFVAAYDQTTGTLGAPQQVATARPLNDDHATPGIVADSQGLLHVLSGGHNTPFMYTHTIDPADPATWSPQEPILCVRLPAAGRHGRRPRPPDLRLARLHAGRRPRRRVTASGAAESTPPSAESRIRRSPCSVWIPEAPGASRGASSTAAATRATRSTTRR